LLNARTKRKPSARKAFGPGSVWQFDSTPLPFAFVMRGNRSKAITEVHMYLCVDVFSHLITGVSLGLARGWEGFAIGLFNSCWHKEDFLEEYKIEDVSWFDWPVEGLPERIVVDNAEGKGINADKLADNLNIHITNTPPYRADLKGLIEALIGYIQAELEKEEKAVRPKKRERGKSDYRLAASRTIEEFMPILVRAINTFNHFHTFQNYPLNKNLIAEDVTLTPISLWLWGLQYCNYMQPLPDLETLRINMYPEADGSIGKDGIYFKGAYYDCVVPNEEDLEQVRLVTDIQNRIAKAGINRRVDKEKPRVLYNKHGHRKTIYLNIGDGEIVECTMREDSANSDFANYTFEEHQLFQNDKTAKDRNITEAKRQQWLVNRQKNQAEGKASKAATKADVDASGLSKTARLNQTRDNTSQLREEEQKKRADKLDNHSTNTKSTSTNPSPSKSDKKSNIPYIPPPDYSSLAEDDDDPENEEDEL
jgi:putative transposase